MAPATASSHVKLAKQFVLTWLTVKLISGPLVKARNARYYHNDNKNKDNRSNMRRHHPSMRHHGFSPNLAMDDSPSSNVNDEDDSTLSESYYERNGLEPPPLMSRSTRQRRRRIMIMESKMESNVFDDGSVIDDANTARSTGFVRDDLIDTDDATLLRRDLIFTGGYDRHAYPWNHAWINNQAKAEGSNNESMKKRTGVPVEMSINFHRVFSVDVISPVLDMIVWLRLEWTDPRLTWNPEEYGNLTQIWFWVGDGGSGGETTEIWTPDIELWNMEDGLQRSLDDAYAIVTHDGSIFWSRPGHLKPACKFYGLRTFPFDRLTCQMEFGSWVYSGKYVRLVEGGGTGFTIGGSETAGESFNEFSFVEDSPVQCKVHVYPPFERIPDEDWPVLMYNVTIQRSWQPYARGYLLTQTLLNVAGFSAFWLPPNCGERMGLSITSMLASVAAEIVVAEKLPAAAEYTWLQKFSLLSMGFAFISLLESVAVLYFYYKRSEDIVPWWFTQVRNWYRFRQAQKRGHQILRKTSDAVHETGDHLLGSGQEILKRTSDAVHEKSDHLLESGQEILKRTSDAVHETSDNLLEKVDQICNAIIPEKTDYLVTNDSDVCDPKFDDIDSLLDENNDVETVAQDDDDSLDSFESEKKHNFLVSSMLTQHSCRAFDDREEDKSLESSMSSFEDEKKRKLLASSMTAQHSSKLGQYEKESSKSIGHVNEELLSLDGLSKDYGLIEARKTLGISNLSFDGHISGNISHRVLKDLKPSTILKKRPIHRVCKTSLEPEENEGQPIQRTKRVSFQGFKKGETSPEPKEKTDCPPLEPRLFVDSLESRRKSMMLKQQGLSTHSMIVPRDADDFRNEEELENNMKWKITAARIDDVARFWIPLSFAIALSIILSEVL